MQIKDILVHVDAGHAAEHRIALAARIAVRHGAHLAGLYVKPIPMPPVGNGPLPPNVILDLQRAIETATDRAREKFDRLTRKEAVDTGAEWRVAQGSVADELRRHARYADIVVIGQHDPDDIGATLVPDSVVLETGRPMLVVPYIGAPTTFAERVMIAWDDSAPATRAVHDAVPLLEGARSIGIVAVNPDKTGDHGDIPCADISLHLARHGLKTEAHALTANDIDVGDVLLSRAADDSCDLMVMGAYGHARWRELVLGGVTRHMLDHMTVPVLMSH